MDDPILVTLAKFRGKKWYSFILWQKKKKSMPTGLSVISQVSVMKTEGKLGTSTKGIRYRGLVTGICARELLIPGCEVQWCHVGSRKLSTVNDLYYENHTLQIRVPLVTAFLESFPGR